jgi:hypothetical protein
MWEDPANTNGGKWTATFIRGKRGSELDTAYFDIVLNP